MLILVRNSILLVNNINLSPIEEIHQPRRVRGDQEARGGGVRGPAGARDGRQRDQGRKVPHHAAGKHYLVQGLPAYSDTLGNS